MEKTSSFLLLFYLFYFVVACRRQAYPLLAVQCHAAVQQAKVADSLLHMVHVKLQVNLVLHRHLCSGLDDENDREEGQKQAKRISYC
jgi:hypothetical protein